MTGLATSLLSVEPIGPEALMPELRIADAGLSWWAGQAVLRLRREVAWSRRVDAGGRDPAQGALDLLRHCEARARFFAEDVAARFLSDRMDAEEPREGRFARIADRAGLEPAERFVLALGLLALVDGAVGPVVALLEGDATRSVPSLALAQRLWDDPVDVLGALDPARPLRRLGLIDVAGLASPIGTSPMLARMLAAEPGTRAPRLRRVAHPGRDTALARRFATAPARLELVVLTGPAAADATGFAARLATERPLFLTDLSDADAIHESLLLAWALDGDVVVDATIGSGDGLVPLAQAVARAGALGMRLFLHATGRDHVAALPAAHLGPVLPIPPQTQADRANRLSAAFPHLGGAVEAVARDFRLEARETDRLADALAAGPALGANELAAAARAECSVDFHGLAEPIDPRYGRSDIVLPPAVALQFEEAIAAIAGAPRLRHEWDCDRRLGDGGIPLLFAGVPGTGKTMAAEVIARETCLPLFRIDLSQVVNKYIGETEKNLARVFDAAEKMRCILFFDEADALFGKRTEVKDANDRFANVETGYLLQRMDNFTGVSVLATNRRKDLDEAFTRRLRYVIEFPVPGREEREVIWRGVFPASLDTGALDMGFLSRQFQLTGGHIRSIALNAALQAAARGPEPAVTMADVLVATRRELDKLRRRSGSDAFGRYWDEIEGLRE